MQNKSVLISIRPEWASLILIGKKTIEVRKNCPHTSVPFKCLIYCTHVDKGWFNVGTGTRLDGSVIAEFTCKSIQKSFLPQPAFWVEDCIDYEILEKACITPSEMWKYLGSGKDFYAWEISDLVSYKVPKSLKDFGIKRAPMSWQYINDKGEI